LYDIEKKVEIQEPAVEIEGRQTELMIYTRPNLSRREIAEGSVINEQIGAENRKLSKKEKDFNAVCKMSA
jgi:hypothetical protein